MMARRRIGRSDLEIAPLMLGGNVFGWTADKSASFAILDAFVDAGFNAIDTSDMYSAWVPGHAGGESETIIGDWLHTKGGRDRVVLATKVGAKLTEPGKPDIVGDLSAAYIVGQVEGSLRRLRTDYIDLYQSHFDDAATPIHETLEAFDRLIRAGKVRAIGASHYSPARLQEALSTSETRQLPRYNSVQPRYNLCDRTEFEGALQQACIEGEVTALCYSALAKGFLTGKYRSEAARNGSIWAERLAAYGNARGQRILSGLEAVASDNNASMARVALSWVIAQPGVAAAIVAVNDTAELGELIGAETLALSPENIAVLRGNDLYP
jgi:aryl-alcohol dehydrogenase-like predicted oxidoreductase